MMAFGVWRFAFGVWRHMISGKGAWTTSGRQAEFGAKLFSISLYLSLQIWM
jgi:hypothetical protein